MTRSYDNSGDFRGATIVQGSSLYGGLRPVAVPAADLAAAGERLARLPLDVVPAVSGLSSGSVLAYRPNPQFVGRAADLKALAATLKGGGTAAIGQTGAVTGLGGIGKTQLAVEFAHRYGQFFTGGVFWLSFADPASVPAEVARCGEALGLGADGDLDTRVRRGLSAWQNDLPRLLIFDNCEDEALLGTWRPPAGAARVLVTARRATWSLSLDVAPLPLGVLSPPESIDLLVKFRSDLRADDPDLAAIAEELGHLPLALHMAGSYLRRFRHISDGSPAAYLAALRSSDPLAHLSLTKNDDWSPTGHELHVAGTFALSFGKLDPADAVDARAIALLFRAACFAAGEPIPRWLLHRSAVDDDDADDIAVEEALARLVALGLIEEERDGSLALHRLVGVFVAHRDPDAIGAARRAVEASVNKAANEQNKGGLPGPLLVWQPHLRAVAEAAAARVAPGAAALLNALGFHLDMIADYAGAKAAFTRALAIDERAFGPDHPEVARDVNNLGGVLRAEGDLAGAKAAYTRALAIDERAFGPDHPNVAVHVNNLGGVLQDEGDLAGAKAAFTRALAIDERAFGPDHPNVAIRVNNLGSVLWAEGDLAGAKAAYTRALAIDERAFGPDHPNVARDVNNLGSVLQDEGDLAGAKAAFTRALAICEKSLGPDHPNTIIVRGNLGSLS